MGPLSLEKRGERSSCIGKIVKSEKEPEVVPNPEFVNMTKDTIYLVDQDEQVALTLPPSGTVPVFEFEHATELFLQKNGVRIPIVRSVLTRVLNLPDPVPGRFLVVSPRDKSYIGESRPDVIAADTGPSRARKMEDGRTLMKPGFQRARKFRYIVAGGCHADHSV